MKKSIFALNIILGLLTIISDVFFGIYGGLWLKGVTSAGFVVMGLINFIYIIKTKDSNKKFGLFMLIGLTLSLIADIVLNIEFMIGALIFASAHVFYVIAYNFIAKFKWKDLIPAAIIFVPSVLIITLVPIFDFGGLVMQIVCVFYALIISCMVGKAIANLKREKCATNIIIVIGSILFFFSDFMLLFDVFANVSHSTSLIFDTLCIAAYWPAQVLLAYSMFHKTLNKTNLTNK